VVQTSQHVWNAVRMNCVTNKDVEPQVVVFFTLSNVFFQFLLFFHVHIDTLSTIYFFLFFYLVLF